MKGCFNIHAVLNGPEVIISDFTAVICVTADSQCLIRVSYMMKVRADEGRFKTTRVVCLYEAE